MQSGKDGQLWYVDSVSLYSGVIDLSMKGRVGVGLRPGDNGIKQDLYHGIERIDQVLQSGHSLKTQVKSLLYEAFLADDELQLVKWQQAGRPGNKKEHVQSHMCSLPK